MRLRNYQGFTMSPIWVIMIINLMVLIASYLSSDNVYYIRGYPVVLDRVQYHLGLMPALLAEKPWTLLTSMFVHENFWHLFGNMLTLYFFGSFLSRLVGQNRFLLLYFGGGLLGNIVFLLWGIWQAPISMVIGASGAVYAVAGALVVMVPKLRVALWGIIPMPLWVVILVFFVLWPFIFGFSLNVAWQAHFGGLVAGLIAGYIFRRRGRYYY